MCKYFLFSLPPALRSFFNAENKKGRRIRSTQTSIGEGLPQEKQDPVWGKKKTEEKRTVNSIA